MLILVSGPVCTGKTTLCLRLVERARERGLCVAGVLAPAVIEDGAKVGILAVEVGSGETRLLARVDRDLGGTRVGPYFFDDQALDWVGACCERALGIVGGLVFVDEIGKLELDRGGGLARLIPLLARPRKQVTVAIVRDFLLDVLLERLSGADARVVRVDAACHEQAWDRLVELTFEGSCCEADRC